ncbi:MAG: sodium:solute symporter [Bacteroidales bacterium]
MLTPNLLILILAAYFAVLILFSWIVSRNAKGETFFTGDRKSPWYVVAFGMIGAAISGVTLISIPGKVGASGFTYMQFVLGNLLGYFFIATVLLPLYYRLSLVSIYSYIGKRIGPISNKLASAMFLISKLLGAGIRLFLVVKVLQMFIMDALGVPYYITAGITLVLIWVYTLKGGIKTVVWTSTMQTLFILTAVVGTIIIVVGDLNMNISEILTSMKEQGLSKMINIKGAWTDGNWFWKDFISGAIIAIALNGLDQDVMQRNLTCKNSVEAKKNMLSLGFIMVPITLLFVFLGGLLFMYARTNGIDIPPDTDMLYPELAFNHLGLTVGILFFVGLIAAAYSSADSTITAMTTSFMVDILKINVTDGSSSTKTKTIVHISMSTLMFITIVLLWNFSNASVVDLVFKTAGYTYAPLVGMFAFGLISKRQVNDKLALFASIGVLAVVAILHANSIQWFGYKVGFEPIVINGLLIFLTMLLCSKSNDNRAQSESVYNIESPN